MSEATETVTTERSQSFYMIHDDISKTVSPNFDSLISCENSVEKQDVCSRLLVLVSALKLRCAYVCAFASVRAFVFVCVKLPQA